MNTGAGFVFCEFGPSTWTGLQWASLAVYVILFLIAVRVAFRIARPHSDPDAGGSD